LIHILVGAGSIAALLGLYHVVEDYLAWLDLVRAVEGDISRGSLLPPSVPRISGVGGHVNVLAMALNLALPFAIASLLQSSRGERGPAAFSCLVILVALFFTVSRGAWLGTAAALSVFAVFYLLRNRSLPSLSRPSLAPAAAAACVLVVVVAGLFVMSSWDSRPEWLFRSSLSPRYDAAAAALEMVRDDPWLGTGPYSYSFLYGIYSGEYPIENIHPHNGYLNVLVDTGLIGGAVLLAGGAILLVSLVRSYQRLDPARRVWLAACAGALSSLFVHAFLDTPNVWVTAMLPFAVVLAITLRLSPPPLPTSDRLVVARRLLVLGVIPVLAISTVFFDHAHSPYDRSLALLINGPIDGAAAAAAEAADADSGSAAYQMNAGVLTMIQYFTEGDRTGSYPPELLDRAIAFLREAVERDPRSAIGNVNLALALQAKADGPGAVTAANRSLDLAPGDAVIAAVAGTILEWAGLRPEASAAYAAAMSRDSGLAQSPFWTPPDRADLRERTTTLSTLTSCQRGRMFAMYAFVAEDLDTLARDCAALIEATPADARARSDLAVILRALGRDGEATAQAERAVQQVPDNPFARTALGIARSDQGDIAGVRHQLLLGAYLGDPDAALFLLHTYEPPPGGSPAHQLRLLSEPGPVPDEVVDRLRDALPHASAMVYDGRQLYLLGVLYYRVRFQRESPHTILVPGEWIDLASPRTLQILEALRSR
jgi:tetratricopeptide (TPR) repeat protein